MSTDEYRAFLASLPEPAEAGWGRFDKRPEDMTQDELLTTAHTLMAVGIEESGSYGGDEKVAERIMVRLRAAILREAQP